MSPFRKWKLTEDAIPHLVLSSLAWFAFWYFLVTMPLLACNIGWPTYAALGVAGLPTAILALWGVLWCLFQLHRLPQFIRDHPIFERQS